MDQEKIIQINKDETIIVLVTVVLDVKMVLSASPKSIHLLGLVTTSYGEKQTFMYVYKSDSLIIVPCFLEQVILVLVASRVDDQADVIADGTSTWVDTVSTISVS